MSFDWQKSQLEVKSLRTHETKHFPHPTEVGKMICIQSSGLLHAFTDKGFEDIEKELPDYNFPEATPILDPAGKDKHVIMDLPAWGDAKVEDNGKTVRVYDKKSVSIYRYKDLLAVPKGEKPYSVIDKDGKSKPVIKKGEHKVYLGERTEQNTNAIEGNFEVADNKLYVKFTGIDYPIDIFDATDTASTNAGDSELNQNVPTGNYGPEVILGSTGPDGLQVYWIWQWTLPSRSGTITKITHNIYITNDAADTDSEKFDLYRLRRTFVENQVTYNVYSTGNNWGTAGALNTTNDVYADVIDQVDITTLEKYYAWTIQGTGGSGTPLSLNWGDSVGLISRTNSSFPGDVKVTAMKENSNAGKRPYLEITYTEPILPSIKSINGLAVASIKSVNGLAITSVKSINGLA